MALDMEMELDSRMGLSRMTDLVVLLFLCLRRRWYDFSDHVRLRSSDRFRHRLGMCSLVYQSQSGLQYHCILGCARLQEYHD